MVSNTPPLKGLLSSSFPTKTKKNYILLIYLSLAPYTYIKNRIQLLVSHIGKKVIKIEQKAYKIEWTGYSTTYLPGRGLWAIKKAHA